VVNTKNSFGSSEKLGHYRSRNLVPNTHEYTNVLASSKLLATTKRKSAEHKSEILSQNIQTNPMGQHLTALTIRNTANAGTRAISKCFKPRLAIAVARTIATRPSPMIAKILWRSGKVMAPQINIISDVITKRQMQQAATTSLRDSYRWLIIAVMAGTPAPPLNNLQLSSCSRLPIIIA